MQKFYKDSLENQLELLAKIWNQNPKDLSKITH